MRIGMTNNFYKNDDGVTDYNRMKADGYGFADYQYLCDTHGVRYTCSEKELEIMLTAERKAAEGAGVEMWQVHGPWYVDDRTEESRAFNLACMKRCALGTALLGSKYMVVHPVMPYGWNKEDDPAWTVSLNEAYWHEVCDKAREYGVNVALENMPCGHHSIGTLPQVADFVRRMDIDNFCICYDTGHSNVTKDKVYDAMVAAGDKLQVLHIHDNRHVDEHRFPHTGSFDWNAFKRGLGAIGFDGVYSLEISIGPQCPAHIKDMYLKMLPAVVETLEAVVD